MTSGGIFASAAPDPSPANPPSLQFHTVRFAPASRRRGHSFGVRIRPLATATGKKYIQPNPPAAVVRLVFDVDRPGAAYAWEDVRLPPPNWSTTNPANGHAHLIYELSTPVCKSPAARQRPIRYLAVIESAFRGRLRSDPGYSGNLTKNPMHADWRLWMGPSEFYDLSGLAEWVDLPRSLPKRRLELVEGCGLGRNVGLFDMLRDWAYVAIREAPVGFDEWAAWVLSKASQINAETFSYPLDSREVAAVTRSVSKGVWVRHQEWRQKFSERQAARGKASGAARRAASEDKRASARLMRAAGRSTRQIAESLGVDQSSIVRWLQG